MTFFAGNMVSSGFQQKTLIGIMDLPKSIMFMLQPPQEIGRCHMVICLKTRTNIILGSVTVISQGLLVPLILISVHKGTLEKPCFCFCVPHMHPVHPAAVGATAMRCVLLVLPPPRGACRSAPHDGCGKSGTYLVVVATARRTSQQCDAPCNGGNNGRTCLMAAATAEDALCGAGNGSGTHLMAAAAAAAALWHGKWV